jgi:hypothetical protein
LKTVDKEFKQLTTLIDDLDDGTPQQRSLLRLRGKILAKTPELIRKSSDFEKLDYDLLERVENIGQHAQRKLEPQENSFGLRRILLPMGHKIGDPNMLEDIIESHFPSKSK